MTFHFVDTSDNTDHYVEYESLPIGGLPVHFRNIGRNWDNIISPTAIREQLKYDFIEQLSAL